MPADTVAVVHYQPPPSGCGQSLITGELWTGNIDRVTCRACIRAQARADERRRILPLARRNRALEHLLVCYRLSMRPTEKLFRELEADTDG